MEKRGAKPDYPPCRAPHLIRYLMEIGPFDLSAGDKKPISNGEIRDWQFNTGIRLNPWQARTLRRLSADFLAEGRRAEEVNCPSPLKAGAGPVDELVQVDAALEVLLSSMAKKSKK